MNTLFTPLCAIVWIWCSALSSAPVFGTGLICRRALPALPPAQSSRVVDLPHPRSLGQAQARRAAQTRSLRGRTSPCAVHPYTFPPPHATGAGRHCPGSRSWMHAHLLPHCPQLSPRAPAHGLDGQPWLGAAFRFAGEGDAGPCTGLSGLSALWYATSLSPSSVFLNVWPHTSCSAAATLPSKLFYGIARDADRLTAHTWIKVGDRIVVGGEVESRFTVLTTFP